MEVEGGAGGGGGGGGGGRIGDLVLAAELMEMVSETVRHVQNEERFELAFGHDHGAYVMPDSAPALKEMVKELREKSHTQGGRLAALQNELASTLGTYKELKERHERDCVLLSHDLASRLSALRAENASLRLAVEEGSRRAQRAEERGAEAARTVLSLSRQLREGAGRARESAFTLDPPAQPTARWLRFHTGFETAERFHAFLRFLTADADLCAGRIRPESPRNPGPGLDSPGSLSHADQLLLVLSRLRLGLLLQDLAYRFRVSETTASRVWLNWTHVMVDRLMQIPVVCSPKYLDAFEPKRAVLHRGATLTVLECTDLFFEVQTKERPRLGAGQPYRAHYVRRGYAVAAPSGYMTFASSLGFGLRASSNARGVLVEEEEGEEEGGRGEAGGKGPRLPDFLLEGEPSVEQLSMSREVLSIRSHTDKVLNFRFLKGVYPRTMEEQVDRAWIICCYLACILNDPMGLR